jgi:hypothetical protein
MAGISTRLAGAGRRMSRTRAKRESRGRDLIGEMERQGILVRATGMRTVAEEMPHAYKDVADVVEVMEQAGVSRRVARLVPVGVVRDERGSRPERSRSPAGPTPHIGLPMTNDPELEGSACGEIVESVAVSTSAVGREAEGTRARLPGGGSSPPSGVERFLGRSWSSPTCQAPLGGGRASAGSACLNLRAPRRRDSHRSRPSADGDGLRDRGPALDSAWSPRSSRLGLVPIVPWDAVRRQLPELAPWIAGHDALCSRTTEP